MTRSTLAGRRSGARAAAVTAVLALSVLLPASSAAAGIGTGGSPTPPSPTPPKVQQVHRCTLYASEVGFGASCAGGQSGEAHTWRELLAGHPFVACHDEPVPSGLALPPRPPGQRDGAYYLETCIVDYDLDQVAGGPHAHPETTLVWIPGSQQVQHVPPWMVWLWSAFDTAYPTPVISAGPTAFPRVNVPAYFWVTPATAAPITRDVFDGVETITMRAELVRFTVRPGVRPDEDPIDCGDGATPYDASRTPFDQASTCTFTYDRSSAHLPQQAYPMRGDAYWQVGYTDSAGTYHQLGVFDIGTIQRVPVQEVEARNG